jgi:hypothetical protein
MGITERSRKRLSMGGMLNEWIQAEWCKNWWASSADNSLMSSA